MDEEEQRRQYLWYIEREIMMQEDAYISYVESIWYVKRFKRKKKKLWQMTIQAQM